MVFTKKMRRDYTFALVALFDDSPKLQVQKCDEGVTEKKKWLQKKQKKQKNSQSV